MKARREGSEFAGQRRCSASGPVFDFVSLFPSNLSPLNRRTCDREHRLEDLLEQFLLAKRKNALAIHVVGKREERLPSRKFFVESLLRHGRQRIHIPILTNANVESCLVLVIALSVCHLARTATPV